jgi:glycerophosphoryl diester phosphodiesterase
VCGRDFELSLDIKDPAALPAVLAAAEAVDASQRLWICHPDAELLARWRQAGSSDNRGRAHFVHSTHRRDLGPTLAAHAQRLAASGIDALNLPGKEWTRQLIAAAQAAGVLAFAWGVQRPPDLSRLVAAGADALYSDHPDRLVQALAQNR